MRWLALVIAAAATLATASCSAPPVVARCDVTLAGLPAGVIINETDPLPANVVFLAGPADFDPEGTKVEQTADGFTFTLALRGDAVGRMAAHTAAHVGDQLAVGVNGQTVMVPMINEAVADGNLQISPGGADVDLDPRLAGCVG
jgi:hypothetical protein